MEFDILEELGQDVELANENTEVELTDQPGQQPTSTESDLDKGSGDLSEEDLTDMVNPEESAQMIVDCFDVTMQFVMPMLHEGALFTKEERETLKDLAHRIKKAEKEGKEDFEVTSSERTLVQLQDESEEYASEIVPLSEREVENLKKPLTKLLERMKFNMSPGKALAFTGFMITWPRVLPIMGAIRERRKRNQDE